MINSADKAVWMSNESPHVLSNERLVEFAKVIESQASVRLVLNQLFPLTPMDFPIAPPEFSHCAVNIFDELRRYLETIFHVARNNPEDRLDEDLFTSMREPEPPPNFILSQTLSRTKENIPSFYDR